MTAAGEVPLRVEGLGGMRFRVSGGRCPHEVDLTDAVAPSCDCEDHQYRRRECKHIRAVVADPQGPMLDAMTAEHVLEVLGPNWERMAAAERLAYGRPDLPTPRDPRTTLRRRWWEAA